MRFYKLAVASALLVALCGCSSPQEEVAPTGSPTNSPSPTESQIASEAPQGTSPPLTKAEAIDQCGDALYFWYPFEWDGTGGWNARFKPGESEATPVMSEWRVVFDYVGGDEESSEVLIDDVAHDGRAATWCETNGDGTYDVGILDGPEMLGATLPELKQVMFDRSGEYLNG